MPARSRGSTVPHSCLNDLAGRGVRLRYHLRSRIRETLAGFLAGRIPPIEAEDFLVWLTEAYRPHHARLEPLDKGTDGD